MVNRLAMTPRTTSLASFLSTVAVGWTARVLLPGAIGKYVGVALWTTALCWLVSLVWPAWSSRRVAAAALVGSWAVELLQLSPIPLALADYHSAFALIFGRYFGAWDLLGYALGALWGFAWHFAMALRNGASQ
ncbi:MAG: DUF2809 domain-containing protein [Myxococcales bacterium]|nr:DUF2809 domain-containing protein [Myxococcales bacterium]